MIKAANGWGQMQIKCLPAELHNRPAQIPPRLAAMLAAERGRWERIFVAYADCGTAGAIDAVCAREGAARLPGADCYHFFAGDAYLEALEETPGTFFLTDFLARHFERIIVRTFKLDSAPENREALFGNYERLIYLSQTRDPALLQRAKQAAAFLGLRFEHRHTGLQGMAAPLIASVA